LVDISKSNFQGNKIALVGLNEILSPVCTLRDLAINAQNAGYSVLIFYFRPALLWLIDDNGMQTDTKDTLLIPVLHDNLTEAVCPLQDADRRNVDISVQTEYLTNMQWYLERL